MLGTPKRAAGGAFVKRPRRAIRVLDLFRGSSLGGFCSLLLADFGAGGG